MYFIHNYFRCGTIFCICMLKSLRVQMVQMVWRVSSLRFNVSSFLILNSDSWLLPPEFWLHWLLNSDSWILTPYSCLLTPDFWLLSPDSWLLTSVSWLLTPDSWILNSGCYLEQILKVLTSFVQMFVCSRCKVQGTKYRVLIFSFTHLLIFPFSHFPIFSFSRFLIFPFSIVNCPLSIVISIRHTCSIPALYQLYIKNMLRGLKASAVNAFVQTMSGFVFCVSCICMICNCLNIHKPNMMLLHFLLKYEGVTYL